MGGTEAFLCNLLENTDFEKYDVTVIAFGEYYSETIVSRLKKLPVKVILNPFSFHNSLGLCLNSYKFFKSNAFDVFHNHLRVFGTCFLLSAFCNGVPVRVTHCHIGVSEYVKKKDNLREYLIGLLKRRVLIVCANRHVACSENAAEYLFKPSSRNKKQYIVIPNGTDMKKFFNCGMKKQEQTEILFVGRLSFEKNPAFVVQVFAEYLKQDPSARLTMVGRGNLENKVNAEISRLNISKYIRRVYETDNIVSFYQRADLLLLPSLCEGCGNVVIEAQATGVKCLVSDQVPQLTQCGLVDYRSLDDGPEAWAEYMSQLLQNDSLKIDREKINFFDIKNTVRMIDEVYKR